MKTIKQQAEVAFNAIEIQDAVAVSALMDVLIETINQDDEYAMISCSNYLGKTDSNIFMVGKSRCQKIYEILTRLGFCGSGNVDLIPKKDKPVELSKPCE